MHGSVGVGAADRRLTLLSHHLRSVPRPLSPALHTTSIHYHSAALSRAHEWSILIASCGPRPPAIAPTADCLRPLSPVKWGPREWEAMATAQEHDILHRNLLTGIDRAAFLRDGT